MAFRRLLLALARECACITPSSAGEVGRAGHTETAELRDWI